MNHGDRSVFLIEIITNVLVTAITFFSKSVFDEECFYLTALNKQIFLKAKFSGKVTGKFTQ